MGEAFVRPVGVPEEPGPDADPHPANQVPVFQQPFLFLGDFELFVEKRIPGIGRRLENQNEKEDQGAAKVSHRVFNTVIRYFCTIAFQCPSLSFAVMMTAISFKSRSWFAIWAAFKIRVSKSEFAILPGKM